MNITSSLMHHHSVLLCNVYRNDSEHNRKVVETIVKEIGTALSQLNKLEVNPQIV